MAFEKGKSGNPKGRPKRTQKEKEAQEEIETLLKSTSVTCVKKLKQKIENDELSNRDFVNACRVILSQAYSSGLCDDMENGGTSNTIKVVLEKAE